MANTANITQLCGSFFTTDFPIDQVYQSVKKTQQNVGTEDLHMYPLGLCKMPLKWWMVSKSAMTYQSHQQMRKESFARSATYRTHQGRPHAD